MYRGGGLGGGIKSDGVFEDGNRYEALASHQRSC